MAAITIRRLDADVVDRFKALAEKNGRSMEEEARRLIVEAARQPKLSGQELVDYLRQRRKETFGDQILPDSVELIREMREEDPTQSPPDAGYP